MKPDWQDIDTVLLDMDGTLLDLHFDNYFWLEHLPRRYAESLDLCPIEASESLHQRIREKIGTLEWYCTEYWSQELGVDIPALKREIQYLISERPHVIEFLEALGQQKKQRVLITNAHHHSLEIKLSVTRIEPLLDRIISSHSYGYPKEEQEFWHRLQQESPFDPARTLFIDDSEPILAAAERYGIGHLLCIEQPDSKKQPRTATRYPAVQHFSQLLDH